MKKNYAMLIANLDFQDLFGLIEITFTGLIVWDQHTGRLFHLFMSTCTLKNELEIFSVRTPSQENGYEKKRLFLRNAPTVKKNLSRKGFP